MKIFQEEQGNKQTTWDLYQIFMIMDNTTIMKPRHYSLISILQLFDWDCCVQAVNKIPQTLALTEASFITIDQTTGNCILQHPNHKYKFCPPAQKH